jgi:hypothetical protein
MFGRKRMKSNIATIFSAHNFISIILAADNILENSIDSGSGLLDWLVELDLLEWL